MWNVTYRTFKQNISDNVLQQVSGETSDLLWHLHNVPFCSSLICVFPLCSPLHHVSSLSPPSLAIMPFVDFQSRFGINLDGWLLLQSGKQPNKRATRCHAFEKEWIECAHGIGQTRAKKECQLEYEDFYECMHRQKTVSVWVMTSVCSEQISVWRVFE